MLPATGGRFPFHNSDLKKMWMANFCSGVAIRHVRWNIMYYRHLHLMVFIIKLHYQLRSQGLHVFEALGTRLLHYKINGAINFLLQIVYGVVFRQMFSFLLRN